MPLFPCPFVFNAFCIWGSQDSLLIEHRTHVQKIVSLNPSRSSGRVLFSRVNFHYSVSIPPHVTIVTPKRPWSFLRKCRWQVTPKQAYTLDPTKSEWADYAVQAWCGNVSGKGLTRNSSGNNWSQSPQLAEPPLTNPCIKIGNCMHKLISRWGMNRQAFLPEIFTVSKSHHLHLGLLCFEAIPRPFVSKPFLSQTFGI